jgi:hypothetical protein
MLDRADQVLETMMWARRFDVVSAVSGGSSALTGDRAGHHLAGTVGEGQTGGTIDLGTWEERAAPRELFRDHVFGCFIDDRFGARHLEEIGWDNVMMETDYPHGDGTFPHSLARAEQLLAPYSADQRYKVMQGNAKRVFRLEELDVPDAGSR